jgi:hypothetical protein
MGVLDGSFAFLTKVAVFPVEQFDVTIDNFVVQPLFWAKSFQRFHNHRISHPISAMNGTNYLVIWPGHMLLNQIQLCACQGPQRRDLRGCRLDFSCCFGTRAF